METELVETENVLPAMIAIVPPTEPTVEQKPTPFTANAVLRAIKALPNTRPIVEEPWTPDAAWLIDLYNTANKNKWLLITCNPSTQEISVEAFMNYNPAGNTWVAIDGAIPTKFSTIDTAIAFIKTELGI